MPQASKKTEPAKKRKNSKKNQTRKRTNAQPENGVCVGMSKDQMFGITVKTALKPLCLFVKQIQCHLLLFHSGRLGTPVVHIGQKMA